ncbi:MAG: PIN domain-containing protein [Candidatus Eremiobacterota bacterium]
MTARSFLDANILVYADDHDAGSKQARSIELIESAIRSGRGVLSTQVLGEYFHASTRKVNTPAEVARANVEVYMNLEMVVLQAEDVLAAIDIVRLHGVSYWDGLILRAAQRSRCRYLYTEDLNHGQKFDGLQVVNPFQTT